MSAGYSLSRRLAAEALGTAFLLMAVVGSGIMGERLSQGNDSLALLANSLATGCALYILILIFLPVSGAHFNPVVTLSMVMRRSLGGKEALAYVIVQIGAAVIGVAAAHLMFGEALFSASAKVRTSWPQWWSEFIAAFGLVMVILGCLRNKISAIPPAVAAYITAAYWFTSSTSFANPAVTLARALSDTFAGIRPEDTVGFILAQVAGGLAATLTAKWLFAVGRKPQG